MNETVNQILTKLIESVTSVQNFVLEQAPDVIQQLLAWNFYSGLIWGTIGILTSLVLVCVFFKKYLPWTDTLNYVDKTPGLIFGAFIFGLFLTISALVGICSLTEALKIYIAPKLWLIEYAAQLIK